MSGLGSVENFENKILIIRGEKVMLDQDLAKFYGVETKRLNEQVRRNIERFPKDFMFQLSEYEAEYLEREGYFNDFLRSQNATSSGKISQNSQNLRSQNATSNHGGRRYLPYVFTEQGGSDVVFSFDQ